MIIKTVKATDNGSYIINQGMADETTIPVGDDSAVGKALLEWRKTNTVEPSHTPLEKMIDREKKKLEREKRLFALSTDAQDRQNLYQKLQEAQMLGEETVFFNGEDLPISEGVEKLRSISLKLRAKDKEFYLRARAIESFETLEDVDNYISEFKVKDPKDETD
jgi:hypothetical protein